jgi:hypothetical protein
MSEESQNVENLISEDALLEWLGINKATLNGLRSRRQFPFVRLTQQCRLYYLPDVINWLLENRAVLNRAAAAKT